MDDLPPELKFNFNCLLKLLHQQKPKHYSYLNTKRFWSCLDNIKCVWGG